jgi:hypothetical protein
MHLALVAQSSIGDAVSQKYSRLARSPKNELHAREHERLHQRGKPDRTGAVGVGIGAPPTDYRPI